MEPTARSRLTRNNKNSARSASSIKSGKSPNSAKKVSGQSKQFQKANSYTKQNIQNRQNILKSQTAQIKQNYGNYRDYRNNLQNINNINSINMAGVGVLNIPGRAKTRTIDIDRYRERVRESQKFPNRRRKIITGKDLTTPLKKAKVKEKKVYPQIITLAKPKKKFPVGVISCVCASTIALLCLIWSYMVLNDYSHNINLERKSITYEDRRERDLESELELKNDLPYFTDIAVNQMGMVKEENLQKHYIAVKSADKVEIVEEQDNIFFRLPSIFSTLLGAK